MDLNRRAYSMNPDNRESLTSIECINGVGGDIPPFLILTGIQLLGAFFLNDLDDNIAMTTADTGYNCDWISLQWIKHFENTRRNRRKEHGDY